MELAGLGSCESLPVDVLATTESGDTMATKRQPVKVSGHIGRKSQVVVEMAGGRMEFTSVTEAVTSLTHATVAVFDWAEEEYQADKTNRRFKDSNC